jgi:hypothetical protein
LRHHRLGKFVPNPARYRLAIFHNYHAARQIPLIPAVERRAGNSQLGYRLAYRQRRFLNQANDFQFLGGADLMYPTPQYRSCFFSVTGYRVGPRPAVPSGRSGSCDDGRCGQRRGWPAYAERAVRKFGAVHIDTNVNWPFSNGPEQSYRTPQTGRAYRQHLDEPREDAAGRQIFEANSYMKRLLLEISSAPVLS